ncbi:hypothetical protein M8818_006544 [Zalaria obscura]|uniref:Uncharacterized protein n=1 Tax=Zalaria obscura TaxID=2024903 RepID=A0ACC3S629_9PEZI
MEMPASPSQLHPHRSDTYSYRVPTPPRIVVPPPTLNNQALPDFRLTTTSTSPSPHHSHLPALHYNPVSENNLLTWSYSQRRQAQPVLPYLYLGPMTAVKDAAFLEQAGITLCVGVRHSCGPSGSNNSVQSRLMTGVLRVPAELGIATQVLDIADNAALIASFPRITEVINSHLSSNNHSNSNSNSQSKSKKILLFCESGNERSAACAAAYLMETHANVDFIAAMQIVQAQRFCVNFDDAVKRVLQSYWDILTARRDVKCHPGEEREGGLKAERRDTGWSEQRRSSGGKRGFEPEGDGDEAMQDVDDGARFERRAFAPFVDTDM